MNAQTITTEAGDELVVLTRRDYDVLLARAGVEEAEDRMTARVIDTFEPGRSLPAWLAEAVADGVSPVKAARKHRRFTG